MKFEHYGLGIGKGLTITLRNLLRRRITTQYPEQKLVVSRRTRASEFVWSKQKCTGCATCAKTCPQGAITVETSRGEENTYSVDRFEIDTGYCISCGLCVEACPYDALTFGYSFELATYRRGELVLSREDMSPEKRRSSGYYHPEIAVTLPEQTLLIERKE